MANSPTIKDEDIPRYVRLCWQQYQDATQELRKEEEISRGFWIGGKFQWGEGETENRESTKRPWLSINRCKPAVDQVENEARNNPPGPKADPVGESGADKDGADIIEGLIREYEYRSDAKTAYMLALRNAAAAMRGVFEMGTEYAGERTMEQQIVIRTANDPSLYFCDPDARMPGLEDSMWAGKVRKLSKAQLIEEYPQARLGKLKVFDRNFYDRVSSMAGEWIESAFGRMADQTTVNLWTGGSMREGPYFVCEFYRVIIETTKLQLHSDNILRYEDEEPPQGVEVKLDRDGDPIERSEPRRRIRKYVVTALDILEQTDWLGSIIPYFWVLGPEMWRNGKCHRLSLISNAQHAQRGLNYTATSCAEIVGTMTKTPFIGPLGTFDVINAQGVNPWEASASQPVAYMEWKPVFASGEGAQETLLPPPQRNTWEAPIARLMELLTFWGEQIKAATAVFFEPGLPSAQSIQSGAAIKALQSQTNVGTLNWQDALRRAVGLSYQQAAEIFPKILEGPRVKTIVRPDSQHEVVEINREFPPEEMHSSGKHKTKDGKLGPVNNITNGKFSVRVIAGPDFEDRTKEALADFVDVLKIAPQILNSPAVAARVVRMVGQGNPLMEEIADLIAPDQSQAASPQQMQTQLQQLQQVSQAKDIVIQRLQNAIVSKLPEIEARKWIAAVNAIAGIREAEIKAGIDKAEIDVSHLEEVGGWAHERGMQAAEHEHASGMADKQAQMASAQSAQDAQQQAAMQPPQGEQQ